MECELKGNLGPGVPIVDCHVHFIDSSVLDYPLFKGSELVQRPYRPEDYRAAADGIPVERVVFVQAECAREQSYDEAVWIAQLAREDPMIGAIVAFAALERGDAVQADLDRLAEIPMVRGVRRLLQGEEDADFALRPGYVAGVRHLARRNLICELGINRRQYAAAVTLCRQCPEVRFVLDHLGVPDIAAGTLDPWRGHIAELATLPNVWCKVSGAATQASRDGWTAEDLRPFIDCVLESFGPARCCFGSDWPVMLRATSWRRWVCALHELTASLSLNERRALFRETAKGLFMPE